MIILNNLIKLIKLKITRFLVLFVSILKLMDNIIFLFSHYDDEFGLFNIIESSVKKNKNVYVLYLTNGLTKENSKNKKQLLRRENESTKILNKLGVKRNKIIFLGKKLNVSVYNLHQKLNVVYKILIVS